jgi:hypothetical protein
VVVQSERTDSLRLESVIEITPLSAKFTQRVKSYLDLGFTLAKANTATTLSVSGNVDYRGPQIGTEFAFDSYAQGQESVETTTRNTLRQSVSWYLPHRWSAVGLAQLEQNDELDLDHRVTAGGAMNRVLKHSNQMELSSGVGVVGTQEQFTSDLGTSSSTSLEGLLVANWDAYRYDSPKLDFSTSLALFPSISQAGRVRGQLQFRLEYELFKDFNADYVTTLTIGWSYRR